MGEVAEDPALANTMRSVFISETSPAHPEKAGPKNLKPPRRKSFILVRMYPQGTCRIEEAPSRRAARAL